MNRENTQFIAGQYGINWCDQLAVYMICRKLQRYLSCWSAMVLPVPWLLHYFQADRQRNVIKMMS